jgi:hypothetical protein
VPYGLKAASDSAEIERLKVARRSTNAQYNEVIKKIRAFGT